MRDLDCIIAGQGFSFGRVLPCGLYVDSSMIIPFPQRTNKVWIEETTVEGVVCKVTR